MAFTTRTLSTPFGTIQMFRGYQVSCFTCHNGPNGGEGGGTQSPAPTVANTSASASSGQSVTIPVTATAGSALRVVSQPQGGTAYVSGSSIVYLARANFEGSDQITYAAINNGRDSNLGTANVTVKSPVRPTFAAASVTNAASYAPGVSPGMIAYLYGANMGPANLASYELNSGGFIEKATAGTRVLFNGVPCPLLYSSDTQVSAIVPYEVAGPTASVIVEYNGIQSAIVPLAVSSALPGIFTANSSGQGQAAVLNQDGSANSASNPAQRGSVVSIFVTGTGATNPAGIDGLLGIAPYPVPMQAVTVTIGGQPATVQYAGGAQGLVAGMMQINAVIPQNIPAGTAVIVVSVGGINSPSAVTVAVQ